jgi:hypothetical protein
LPISFAIALQITGKVAAKLNGSTPLRKQSGNTCDADQRID